MMKLLAVFALLAVSALARSDVEYRNAFTRFIRNHQKTYSQEEFVSRFNVFKANVDFIDSWNTKGYHTVGINKFADLSLEEFSKMYMGTHITVNVTSFKNGLPEAAPTSVDWRPKGAVTAIKDQGQCGSCWAFSTTGSTEAAHFFANNTLVSLSEQDLVDCSKKEGNEGCNGGLMTKAMDYIIKNKGIDTEESYPYKAVTDLRCKFTAENVGATLSGYTNVEAGSETDLAAKVVLGPTSVAIDASHSSFQLYTSGIYYEPACSATQLDHGVLAVGYDTEAAGDYWIVKNSWGVSWGSQGYIWMSRNKDNNCGIATSATLPQA